MQSRNLEAATVIGECPRSEVQDKGYTVVPFLDPDDIQALLALHAETHTVVPHDFYVSALDPYELRSRICEGISAILTPKLDRLVTGYRIILASFVTKKANSTRGKLDPHQDYTLVDQSKHVALNVWVPLCNVDIRNGCMRMVGYSQRFDHIGATSPNPSVYSKLIPELEANYLTDVPMTAGEALIFDARALHATDENATAADRPALLFSLVPNQAQSRFYFWNAEEPGRLELYEGDTDFLLHLPARRYPTPEEKQGGTFQGYIDYAPQPWTLAELERAIPRPVKPVAPAPSVISEPVPEPVAVGAAPSAPAQPSLLARLARLLTGSH
jgi:hypothetical protein